MAQTLASAYRIKEKSACKRKAVSGRAVAEFVWLEDTLVAILSDAEQSTWQLVETDHLNTPRAVIHPTKNTILWRWNLSDDPFGTAKPDEDPDGNRVNYTLNLRFSGQFFDSETGLVQNGHRTLDSNGRYLETDPIGQAGGMSTYGYANQNPLFYIDPEGLNACGTNDNSACSVVISITSRSTNIYGVYNDGFTSTQNSANYNAVAVVSVNGIPYQQYLARTLPSDATRFATVANGEYSGNRTLHHRKYPAIAFNADGSIPTVGENPRHPGQFTASAIHIHRAGVGNFVGVTRSGGGVSEGCPVIATDQYQDFQKTTGIVVPKGDTPQMHFSIFLQTNENQ